MGEKDKHSHHFDLNFKEPKRMVCFGQISFWKKRFSSDEPKNIPLYLYRKLVENPKWWTKSIYPVCPDWKIGPFVKG